MKRKCALCGCKADDHGKLYDFTQLLRELGTSGKWAHSQCVSSEQQVHKDYFLKYGKPKIPVGSFYV